MFPGGPIQAPSSGYFEQLLAKFSTPEELFGIISLKALDMAARRVGGEIIDGLRCERPGCPVGAFADRGSPCTPATRTQASPPSTPAFESDDAVLAPRPALTHRPHLIRSSPPEQPGTQVAGHCWRPDRARWPATWCKVPQCRSELHVAGRCVRCGLSPGRYNADKPGSPDATANDWGCATSRSRWTNSRRSSTG